MSKDKRSYKNCCSAGCLNTTYNCDLTFFSLPRDTTRQAVWLKLLGREDLIERSSTYYRVCENHFECKFIILTPTRKVLKRNALPCILLPRAVEVVQSQESKELCTDWQVSITRKRKIKSPTPDSTKEMTDTKMFLKLCDKFLSTNLVAIVKQQVNMHRNRYSNEYKIFCLSLLLASPQAYSLLSQTLCLPKRTLLLGMYRPLAKDLDHIMKLLQMKVSRMTDREKCCSLVVDAIKLKANLTYITNEDKIFGFHEVDELQFPKPAEYGVVAAVRGLSGSYEQLVAYALLPATTDEETVSEWIDHLIRKLCAIGLDVRVLISSTSFDFLNSVKTKRVSIQTPYFWVDDRKIYYMYDALHLMLMMRDNLMRFDFHFDGFVAKWNDIRQFYEKDAMKQLKLAPNLSESHVNPEGHNRTQAAFVVHVFSATVAAAMSIYKDLGGIHESAEGTIRLITVMNDVVKFFNLTSRCDGPNLKNVSDDDPVMYRFPFILSLIYFFTSLKLIDQKTGMDVTLVVPLIPAFQVTLKSILNLFTDLKIDGYTLTKKLNKGFLETMFDEVKFVHAMEPTSWQLVTEFRNKYLEILFEPRKQDEDSENEFSLSNELLDGMKLLGYRKEKNRNISIQENSSLAHTIYQQQENIDTGHHIAGPSTSVTNEMPQNQKQTTDSVDTSLCPIIKQEPEMEDMEVNEEEIMLKIKQEQEDFLNMDFEVEEHELIISSREQEHNYVSTRVKEPAKYSSLEGDTGNLSDSIKEEPGDMLAAVVMEERQEDRYPSYTGKQELDDIITYIFDMEDINKSKSFERIPTTDCSNIDFPEKNALVYLSGRLLEKCLSVHKDCSDFKSYIQFDLAQNPDDDRYIRYKKYCKDDGNELCVVPPDDFVECIEIMDVVFCKHFKARHMHCKILSSLLTEVKNLSYLMPCKCFPIDYIKNLFFKIRIYHTLNYNNRDFHNCVGPRKFSVPSL